MFWSNGISLKESVPFYNVWLSLRTKAKETDANITLSKAVFFSGKDPPMTRYRKMIVLASMGLASIVALNCVMIGEGTPLRNLAGSGTSHVLTMDSTNQIASNSVKINASYSMSVFSSNLTSPSGHFASITSGGYFGNDTPLYDITSFAIKLASGSIFAYFGHSSWSREQVFSSGYFTVGTLSSVVPGDSTGYFYLAPGSDGCVIDTIEVHYGCLKKEWVNESNGDLFAGAVIPDSPKDSTTLSCTSETTIVSGSSSLRSVHIADSHYGSAWPSVLLQLKTPLTVKTGGNFTFDAYLSSGKNALSIILYNANWKEYQNASSSKGEYASNLDGNSATGAWHSFSFYNAIQASSPGVYNASTNPYVSSFAVSFIRVIINTNDATSATSLYLDNFKYNSDGEFVTPTRSETTDEGLENCPIDTGASTATGALDASKVYGISSASALRTTFSATGYKGIVLNTETNSVYPIMNAGTLSGDFYFKGVTASVSLVVSPYGWAGDSTSIALPLTAEGSEGWYHMELPCSSIVFPSSVTDFRALRLWLNFPSVTSTSGHVWIDNLKHLLTSASLWKAYNTENLLQDVDYSTSANGSKTSRGYTLGMKTLAGEKEAIQLMITPTSAVSSYTFTMGSLSGSAGTISASQVSVYAEKYFTIDSSTSNETASASGAYPDALIPLAYSIAKGENTIASGANQGLYFIVDVPSTATAGTYRGNGTLTLNTTSFTIPFELNVLDLAMPSVVHPKSSFLMWYDQIANYYEGNSYGTATTEIRKSYYDFMVDHRVMPDGLPDIYEGDATNGYTGFADNFATYIASNDAINSYRLTFSKNNDGTINATDASNELTALINKNIALQQAGTNVNFFDKVYFYIDDEPTTSDYSRVASNTRAIKTLKTSLSSKLDAYPALKASFLAIEDIVTMAYPSGSDSTAIKNRTTLGVSTSSHVASYYYNESASYNDGINTWCPTYEHFHSSSDRSNYQTRVANGEHVWWYGCINPIAPYPTYHLNASLLPSRLLSWMEYDYGIEGNLYWCCNYFSYYNGSSTALRDVWSTTKTWENCYGDGDLLYPGNRYGTTSPLATLRLESIREAQEDYEYLYLFNAHINQYNSTYSGSKSSATLLNTYYSQLFSGVQSTCTSEAFENVRQSLLTTLAGMKSDLKTTVESL